MITMMDLPNLFSSSPKKDKLFLGLVLTQQSVQAILWKIAKGNISVIKTSEIIDIKEEDQTIIQTDQALQDLGELAENLNEVLLGLESSWVNPKGVVDAKKPLLKKLTEELSLKPVGFVVTLEAVTQYLSKENPLLNTILLFYTKNKISVSLVENGILQKTESVGRSDNAVNDFIEALARFKSNHKKELPPTVKLVSVNLTKEELFEQHQSLVSHDWVSEGYFISTPTLENLNPEISIQGVINQGGQAVAKSHGLEVTSGTKDENVIESDPAEFAFKEVDINKNNSKDNKKKKEKDDSSKTAEETIPAKEDDNLTAVPTSFGIPINSKKLPDFEESPEEVKQHKVQQPEHKTKKETHQKESKLMHWFHEHKKFAFFGFISGILALLLIGFIGVTFSGKAVITLNLNPKNLSKDISITLDPSISESSFEDLTLKSELVSKNFFFNQTNETTGVTLVGEKSSGKIQISNKTDGTKTFTAGTGLTVNGVRFTLDDDVTIASASVEIKSNEEVKSYGTSEANISAVKIGADANLDIDVSLVLGDFSTSSYEARVIEQMSGGSSREIRVVSEEDLTQLMLEVKKKILEIATQEYKNDSDKEETVTFISTNKLTVTEQNYSGEEADEAKTISLELSADVEAISFENGDIKPLAEHVLKDLVPQGFEIVDKEPSILSDVNEESATSSAIIVDANISTQAIPIIDYNLLKQEISSKNISSAQAILNGKSDIKSFVIELFPKILESIWKKLPNKAEKIEFKIE
jgi:hypothetical protein